MTIEVMIGFAVLFVSICLIYLEKQKNRKYSDIPCARPRLPFFGNAWSISLSKCHLTLTEWAKRFGPVYRIRLYNEEILVLNSFEAIFDALVVKGSDFAGRPSMYRTHQDDRHEHSIVWQTFTENLQFLRKEVLRSFKTYGNGLESLEERCFPEMHCMLDMVAGHGDESFDPWDHVYEAVSNVMLGLTLNQRFDSSSSKFHELKNINQLFNDIYGSGNGRNLDFLPWLRPLRHYIHYKKLRKALRLRDRFWTRELFNLKEKGFQQCIVQRLISALSSSSSSQNDGVEEKTAKEVFTNLILAGTDTTATALTSLLLVFLHQPEVQEKMWEEIRLNIGSHRCIKLTDRPLLPYCEAVLLELLRFISHVPLAVPHCTIRNTSVLNIAVPKDMTVYINLWSLHHSSDHWQDSWTFQPSRFLDTSGKIVPASHPHRKMLMAFGAGRRVCLGEVLAKNRLFLFATALVQRFQFSSGNEKMDLPTLDPRSFEMGLVIHPKPFHLKAKERYQYHDHEGTASDITV